MLNEHGTKILGVVIALLGSVMLLTPEQITAIMGERGPGIMTAIAGLLTVLRGFQNSGSLPGGPKKEE